jgi:cystathionine beta-lyase/cystathionine gamma-synthase
VTAGSAPADPVLATNAARIEPDDELICLGHGEDLPAQGGAMAPPLVQTSLFAFESLAALQEGLAAEHRHHVYTRGQNPTVEAVEGKLAMLERGEACKAFASGMAAVSAVLQGLLAAGDEVLFVNQVYGPTLQLAERLRRFGVSHRVLLDLDPTVVAAALTERTRLLWMESPGTMLFRVADVTALAAVARERGVVSVIDNSWATPLFQKPLTLGVDLVIHSATKYLGGHSDLVAGALVGNADLVERLFYDAFLLQGGLLAPFDAWLLNRGLRTLPARMRGHHAGGLELARFLAEHPRVRRVFHPALVPESAALARGQLGGFSGLFSFELDTAAAAAVHRFVDSLRLFRIGVSWGGVESLVIAPLRGDNRAALAAQGIPPGLVRLSVGLEPAERLVDDLTVALHAL